MKGVWIVLEGIDGSGTTTQMHHLQKLVYEADKSHKVLTTAEPTMGKFGSKIRDLMLNPNTDIKSSGKKLKNWFIKDREEHLNNYIYPLLQKGVVILQDRFMYSTLVYQGAQGENIEEIIKNHNFVHTTPNLTLIFDLELETALKRTGKNHQELFDGKRDFLEKVNLGYQNIPYLMSSREPQHYFKKIDASKTIEEVTIQCWDAIKSLLPYRYEKLKNKYNK